MENLHLQKCKRVKIKATEKMATKPLFRSGLVTLLLKQLQESY